MEKKKSHIAEKLKGGTLWGLSTSILSQNIKKFNGEKLLFSEENLTRPKKTERGTLWDFSTSILSQNSKKIEKGTLWGKLFSEERLVVPKKIERGSRTVWYVTRENRKNLFGSLR